jgi:hypothetical protein
MFQKKSELTYITKNTTREELIDECRRLKNLVCQLRHVKKKHVKTKTEKKREAVKEWKERFNKKSGESFKKSQIIWGKDVHIERLRRKLRVVKKVGIKQGYKAAMKRVMVSNYKVKHVAHFLMKANTVMEIYKLNFKEYAFLLWAGRYDFFSRKDFTMTVGDVDISYYSTVNALMKKGLITIIARNESQRLRLFSLTGTGVDMYNKIAKFTNKFLKRDTGASDLRDNVQDAGSSKKTSKGK